MRQFLPLLGVLLLTGCMGGKPPAEQHGMPPPQLGVASPIIRELPVEKELTGTIEAIQTVQLNPQVSGLVTKVHVTDGAEVKAGDPILDIDLAPFKAAVARGKAEVARAESQVHLAQLQFERGKKLVEDKVISRQQFDDYEAGVKIAEANMAASKAALETAELDVGYARVTAPISGRIGKILTTTGNLVQGGGPVQPTFITTIVSLDPVYVTFDVDEGTWNRLGDRLRASAAGKEPVAVSVGVTGVDGYPHDGKVVFVDNKIDQGSGSMRVRAQIPNPERNLTPGAFARVRLQLAPPAPALLIHERAILSQINSRYVYALDAENKAQIRPVVLGDSIGALRVVTSGLSKDDRIVVIGHAKLFMPGMTVAPLEASMENAALLTPDAAPAAHPPAADAATTSETPAPAAETTTTPATTTTADEHKANHTATEGK